MLREIRALGWLTLALLVGGAPATALTIVINPDPGLAANTAALAAFERAADQYEVVFSDPITVNIDASLAALGPTIIGGTSSVFLGAGFDTIRNAMVTDAASETDDGIVASLPTAATFSAFLPAGFGITGNLTATKANLKALGFTGLDTVFGPNDASITFNSSFSFDFDNSDGVGSGLTDFETVAAHEIGHALGFVSVVDDIDFLIDQLLTDDISPNPLDLFRFDDVNDPTNAADFATLTRSLIPNNGEVFDDVDFFELAMSTGRFTGDGRQASHWKDDDLSGTNIGIMDPTLASGVFFDLATTDIRALDVIGYDVFVPEPSTVTLLGLGLGGLALVRSRRR